MWENGVVKKGYSALVVEEKWEIKNGILGMGEKIMSEIMEWIGGEKEDCVRQVCMYVW
jgi:hypothetical protein